MVRIWQIASCHNTESWMDDARGPTFRLSSGALVVRFPSFYMDIGSRAMQRKGDMNCLEPLRGVCDHLENLART